MNNHRAVAQARPVFIERPEDVQRQKEFGQRLIAEGTETLYLVGCGGSLGAYGPAAFTLVNQVPQLAVQVLTSDEFNYRKPARLGPRSVVLVGSHTGTTPETVRAIRTAKDAGVAQVASLTSDPDSPLATEADVAFTDQPAKWAWDPKQMAMARITQGIRAAAGLRLPDLDAGLAALPLDLPALFDQLDPALASIAAALAEEPIVYLLGSGPMESAAQGMAMFYLQEMLWRDAAAYNIGEFFHGPFELVTDTKPFVLLRGEDETRPMSDRAITFLNRYTRKLHVIDSRDFGLPGVPVAARAEVVPIVMSAVTTRLAQHFEAVLDHDLSTRRYMFTVQY
jgi:fructoselysine-6-P-deglycase FrlB-like protein